ncbi:minor tail protein [Mycobacterium phage Harley]|uniref:Minor tail protein n=2 Tax=Cheoctovirus TaxID=1623281 RepID=A0A346FBW3_9CAUD|nr:minor tail protein [Mycobacterium phage Harley]AXN53188.1 minor tail protein [Mycobacterium phage Harley]
MMAYTKQTWENVPSTNTPLSADRLSHIEDGIADAHSLADGKADASHTHLLVDVTDVVATADEVNVLAGITATTTELNTLDGVTSNVQTQLDGKASSSHAHSAGDITSGTLNIARIPVGNSGSTVCAGNDSRLSDQRTPSDGSVSTVKIQDGAITNAKVATSAAIAASKLSSNVQASLSKADESVQKSGTATGMWMGTTLPGSGTAGVLYVVVP